LTNRYPVKVRLGAVLPVLEFLAVRVVVARQRQYLNLYLNLHLHLNLC